MKSTSASLSQRQIDRAKPRETDWILWDKILRGFGVRIYPSGRKRFVVQYSLGPRGAAKTFRFNLDDYPALSVDAARNEAARIVADAREAWRRNRPDLDPAKARQERREGAMRDKVAETMADLVEHFLKARKRKLKPSTYREWKRLLKKEVVGDPFGKLRVSQVTTKDLEKWHEARADRPVLANRGVSLLGTLLRFAAKQGLRSEPVRTEEIERHREQRKRKRLLAPDEYAALGKALTKAEAGGLEVAPSLAVHNERRKKLAHKAPMKRGPYETKPLGSEPASPFAIGVIRFLALSGWRRDEALGLRRDAVDFARKVAILDDTKAGRSSRPLGSKAIEVLKSVPEIEGSPYFFPGLDKDKPLSPPTRVWTAVRHEAKVSITLHGLRHAFTTVARELGYGDHVIARLVGHTLQGITSRYGDVPSSTTAEAAERVSALIAQRLGN